MKMNNKGLSLIETLIAAGILGLNALGFMQIQKVASNARVEEKSFEVIKNSSDSIQAALSNRATCLVNFKDKVPGDTLSQLEIGKINTDPSSGNDYQQAFPISAPGNLALVLPTSDLGEGVEIDEYKIVSLNNQDYLEVTFSVADHRNTLESVNRRFLLNVKKDPVTGVITDCLSELNTKIYSVAEASCAAENGVYIPAHLGENGELVRANCDHNLSGGDPPTPAPDQINLGPGASYKLTYDEQNKRLELEGKKCTPGEPRYVTWDCVKGKHLGIKGVNWVNACYYASTCAENPLAILPTRPEGYDFFIQGPTKARGGDTGTKRNCKRKRKACPGEKTINQPLEKLLTDELQIAEEYAIKANRGYLDFTNKINSGTIEEIILSSGTLKIFLNKVKSSCDTILKEKNRKLKGNVLRPHKSKTIERIFNRAESIKKQVYSVDNTSSLLQQIENKAQQYKEDTGHEIW